MKLTDLAKLVSTNISQGRAHFDVAVYQPPEGHGCTLVSEVLDDIAAFVRRQLPG